MLSTSEFKIGSAIKYNNEQWMITGYQFVNPGKGAAFVRTKLKNLKSGKVLEVTFKSGEKVEEVDLMYRTLQYLYKDANAYYFMDQDYNQHFLTNEIIGERSKFFKENMEVKGIVIEDNLSDIVLPMKLDFKVIEAPPGVKGDTATGGSKPIVIETGATINAPLFIKEGDVIRINTETEEYVERVNQ